MNHKETHIHVHIHVQSECISDPEITDPELIRLTEELVATSQGLADVVPNPVGPPGPGPIPSHV